MITKYKFFVYITASQTRVLYVGFTDDLPHRIRQHKSKVFKGFTAKYNVDRLVYSEEFSSAAEALAREKQLKRWSRTRKIALIETQNPKWRDFSEDVFLCQAPLEHTAR